MLGNNEHRYLAKEKKQTSKVILQLKIEKKLKMHEKNIDWLI